MKYTLADGIKLFGSRATFYRYLEQAKQAGFPPQYRRMGHAWLPDNTYLELKRVARSLTAPAPPAPKAPQIVSAADSVPPARVSAEEYGPSLAAEVLALAQEVTQMREFVKTLPTLATLAHVHTRLERAEEKASTRHETLLDSLDSLCLYLETEFDRDRARLALLEGPRPESAGYLTRLLHVMRNALQRAQVVGRLSLGVQKKGGR